MVNKALDVGDLEARLERLEPHLLHFVAEVVRRCQPDDDLGTMSELFERLSAIDDLRNVLDETIRLEVQQLRRWQSAGWPEIAAALGISRQGARQKYQHVADAEVAAIEDLFEAEVAALKAELDAEIARARLEGVRAGRPSDIVEQELARRQQEFLNEHAGPLLTQHMERLEEAKAKARSAYAEGDE